MRTPKHTTAQQEKTLAMQPQETALAHVGLFMCCGTLGSRCQAATLKAKPSELTLSPACEGTGKDSLPACRWQLGADVESAVGVSVHEPQVNAPVLETQDQFCRLEEEALDMQLAILESPPGCSSRWRQSSTWP